MKNIYLIGFMGTGKSAVGSVLAEQLGMACVEMDRQIETQQNMTITEIFERYGEAYFRDLETEFLRMQGSGRPVVVSCGGGSVLREENAALMRERGSIVLLTARPETVYERVKRSTNRPVLNGHMSVSDIGELMEKRRVCYEEVADLRVATDGRSVREICEEIQKRMAEKQEQG